LKNNNLPELRFSSFDGEWNQHKLSDLCDEFRSGKSIKAQDIRDEGRYPVLGGNGLRGYTNTYNHDGIYALIGRQGALCGNMNISYGKAYFTEHAIAVKGNENNDTRFLFYLLGKMNLGQYSGQSAQPGLAVNKLIELTSFIPTRAEQTKISDFFKQLDETIALHHQELATLKQTKQGFLQKMFPKEGESLPELRFPGFIDEWVERKLGEISFKVKDKNLGGIYSETLTNSAELGIINQREFFDKDISNKKNLGGYYVVRPDDFVYNPRISNLAPVGPIKRNKLGRIGVISPLYYVFRTHGVDNTYLESYFSSTSWHEFMKLNGDSGARSDRFAIKDSVFAEMPIPFPSLVEQTKIGEFFKQIDKTISLHQQELDALQQTKKAFLQKMFV